MGNQQKVERIFIPAADGLDSIVVYVEEWRSRLGEHNQGSITAVCYGEAWNFIAGNIGDRTFIDFIKSTNSGYLGNKFAVGIERFVADFDAINKKAGTSVSSPFEVGLEYDRICKAFGPDFGHDLPQTKNRKFEYVEKIAARIIEFLNSEEYQIAA